jgi:fibronectin type 3 domain-containing protein
VEGAETYSIYRKASKRELPVLVGTSQTTEFDDTTAIPGCVYTYQVQVDGEFVSSGLGSAAKGSRKLAPPQNVNASDGGRDTQDRVVISWTGVVFADSYSVYRAVQGKGRPKLLGTTDTTAFADLTSIPGQNYLYSVKANNEYTSSDFSPPDAGHRPILPPQAVSATDGQYPDKIAVTWNAIPGITSYEVYRTETLASAPGNDQLLVTVKSKAYYDDKTAQAGKTYFYYVKAVNAYGKSELSAPDAGYRSR